MKIHTLAVMAWALAATGLAHAERAADIASLPADSKIRAYVHGTDMQKQLLELGRQWDRKLGLACEGEHQVRIVPTLILVYKPIEMTEQAAHPSDGVWQYRFELERCGSTKTYNAIVVARPDGAPRLGELLPGKTAASPVLMRDTLPTVYMKITLETKLKDKKECKDFAIKDTDVTVLPAMKRGDNGQLQVDGPYEEAWTVRYCGADVSVPLCFTPQPSGGTSFQTRHCTAKG